MSSTQQVQKKRFLGSYQQISGNDWARTVKDGMTSMYPETVIDIIKDGWSTKLIKMDTERQITKEKLKLDIMDFLEKETSGRACDYRNVRINEVAPGSGEMYYKFASIANYNLVDPKDSVYSPENLSHFRFFSRTEESPAYLHYVASYRKDENEIRVKVRPQKDRKAVIFNSGVHVNILGPKNYTAKLIPCVNEDMPKYFEQVKADLELGEMTRLYSSDPK